MKSSSAWLTSSAWVQMTVCGSPAVTVQRVTHLDHPVWAMPPAGRVPGREVQ
jgi:hypothetical protein